MKTEQEKLKICVDFLESRGYVVQKKAVQIHEMPAAGFLRVSQLLDIVPFSKASIWRLSKTGGFPSPVKLSDNVTAWRGSDVQSWFEARAGK